MSRDPWDNDVRNPANEQSPPEEKLTINQLAVMLYDKMEDWDGPDDPEELLIENWTEIITDFNAAYNTSFKVESAVRNYRSWKKEKYAPDI